MLQKLGPESCTVHYFGNDLDKEIEGQVTQSWEGWLII